MLLTGTWEFDLKIDGRRITSSDEWEEVCWVSDEDVDYLELELALDDDIRLQRQLLLARDDGFLYLSECLLDTPGGKTEFTSRLPLADGITFETSKETRDGCLKSDKSLASVIPLALPEWRVDPRQGTLSVQDNELHLNQQTIGKNLCCPLFFDLNSRRHTKQRTWRQLTVAQSLETVSHDIAVGYRIQSNKDQWLIYRSLVEPANRTLLGHNLASEFEVGRFTAEGDCEEMLEIE
jgi:hypothetical protein